MQDIALIDSCGGSVINTGALSEEELSVITVLLFTRWMRNFAKNNRYH